MGKASEPIIEVNFDGLVGPTHNYGGLSYGNVASLSSAREVSSPKQAALQGLEKAKVLADRGLPQGILPPQMRPNVAALRNLGFTGSDSEVIQAAWREDKILLAIVSSSAFMWTANAATVCPSVDSTDGKVHLTPANLQAKPHRSIEAVQTQKSLRAVFRDKSLFDIHDAIDLGEAFSDEGAANHTRFEFGGCGLHLFVYGRESLQYDAHWPWIFPARQTKEASRAVARVNRVPPELCFFAQQDPTAIDTGAFHNDVVSVGHCNVFLYHERAFIETEKTLSRLRELSGGKLIEIKVGKRDVDLPRAVKTYLFNSQIVTMPEGHMAIIAPQHCREDKNVRDLIDKMLAEQSNPIDEVLYFDLLQSMKNGGGPACLRLRVPLTAEQLKKVNSACLLCDSQYKELTDWVKRHYRDELRQQDLADARMLEEVQRALAELTDIMDLGNLYSHDR